jgi:hypothetical protein
LAGVGSLDVQPCPRRGPPAAVDVVAAMRAGLGRIMLINRLSLVGIGGLLALVLLSSVAWVFVVIVGFEEQGTKSSRSAGCGGTQAGR